MIYHLSTVWSQAVKDISAILGSAMALEIAMVLNEKVKGAYVFEKQILSWTINIQYAVLYIRIVIRFSWLFHNLTLQRTSRPCKRFMTLQEMNAECATFYFWLVGSQFYNCNQILCKGTGCLSIGCARFAGKNVT